MNIARFDKISLHGWFLTLGIEVMSDLSHLWTIDIY